MNTTYLIIKPLVYYDCMSKKKLVDTIFLTKASKELLLECRELMKADYDFNLKNNQIVESGLKLLYQTMINKKGMK